MKYRTKGTCSSAIDIELDNGIIKSVHFTGGCNGNLQGISRLVEGMPAKEAISRLKGTNAASSLHPALISWLWHWNPLWEPQINNSARGLIHVKENRSYRRWHRRSYYAKYCPAAKAVHSSVMKFPTSVPTMEWRKN